MEVQLIQTIKLNHQNIKYVVGMLNNNEFYKLDNPAYKYYIQGKLREIQYLVNLLNADELAEAIKQLTPSGLEFLADNNFVK